jgi:localization factor PodJL
MKFAVPWSVKGIRPEARETAKEAARRSGMPLGEWLNSVILQQAEQDGASAYGDDDDAYGQELATVHQRLDDITRRIETFTKKSPAAYAPKAARGEPAPSQQSIETAQLAQLIARLDQRIDQMQAIPRMMAAPPMAPQMPHPQMAPRPPQPPMPPPALDRAVAEIAARQRSLNGGAPAPGRTQQPVPPQVQAYAPPQQPLPPVLTPVPTQDLSGLEEHLRQITDQIETLRRPGVEEAINALRGELGEIAHALSDAMPRQAIDAIEKQIQGLTHRIAEGRQAGVDAGALSGVEHGLAEVRDALRGLTPAESLVGFNEAVGGLAHKIDLIVAQKDPATLGQLEHAITTLRDMAGHIASNETVGRLAAQVHELAQRIEHYGAGSGAGDALNSLEHRISALADALAERSQNGTAVPPRLEALVESLSDKIEQIQQTRGDSAVGHLEDHIVTLVKRLDASDSRLGHLEAIERGLGDLLVHIEEMRAGKGGSGPREENQGVLELKHDIARTQNALDAVHGTLGLMVDRLATIERDVRGARSPLDLEATEITQPVGKIAARAVNGAPPASMPQPAMQAPMPQPPQAPPMPQPAPPAQQQPRPQPPVQQPAPQQAAKPQRLPQAARLPINPDLPPDQPLEPGSGAPRFQANAAARIAASEAALGGARPQPNGPAGKSGFIAAARRAAQSAIETATPRKPAVEAVDVAYFDDSERPTLRASIMKRVKTLFIAASIVAIVIGGIQIVGNVFNIGGAPREQNAQGLNRAPDTTESDENTAAGAEPALPDNRPTMPLAPPMMPGTMSPQPNGSAPAAVPPQTMLTPGQQPPSLLSPSAITAPNADITGSIGRNPIRQNPVRPAPAPTPVAAAPAKSEADKLPIALGGTKLRSAAAGGDAAAAYEVALRFAEGRGIPADPEEAARWYERAASKGLPPAQFRYASLLEKGIGVRKNLGQARRLYLAAATQGHAKAMHNLAVLYAEGIEGKPDYGTAALWFRKAAQHGIADSQYNLGVLCARGLGTDKNVAEAYKWFALAAAQGDREAAKKRDDVAAHLDAQELASARDTARSFVAEPQPNEANNVPVPQGGWDDATTNAPQPAGKPRGTRAVSASVAPLPMNIGRAVR